MAGCAHSALLQLSSCHPSVLGSAETSHQMPGQEGRKGTRRPRGWIAEGGAETVPVTRDTGTSGLCNAFINWIGVESSAVG